MDGALNTRQSIMTYQMKVLINKNQDFINAYKGLLSDEEVESGQQQQKPAAKRAPKDKET